MAAARVLDAIARGHDSEAAVRAELGLEPGLDDEGLLLRTPDPGDARHRNLSLTARGGECNATR